MTETETKSNHQMEGRVNQEVDAAVVSRDAEVDGDSSKAKDDGVVTPSPIIGVLAQGSVEQTPDTVEPACKVNILSKENFPYEQVIV